MADVPIDLTDNTDEVINLTSPRKSLAQEEDERLSAAAAILLASVPPDTLKPGKARRLCRKQLGDPSLTPAAVAARARATVDESPGAGDEPGLECGCCFCETPLPELVQCSEGHVFCRDCLAAYAREQVFGGGRARLACMCRGMFVESQLRAALPPEQMAKLEETAAAEAARSAALDLLRAAAATSCVACRGPAHGEDPCPPRKRGRDGGDAEDAKRLRVEEALTEAKVRTCPACGAKFFKSDGCNKMTCACGAWSCYVCRAPIPKDVGYKHFCQTPHCDHSKCGKCRLYTDDAEDERAALAEAAAKAREESGADASVVEGLLDQATAPARGAAAGPVIDFRAALDQARRRRAIPGGASTRSTRSAAARGSATCSAAAALSGATGALAAARDDRRRAEPRRAAPAPAWPARDDADDFGPKFGPRPRRSPST
ncbi:hypothetical protein JL720_14032 [Aureococcus anophagefferens]|nr:hypothetical protein JL720_14032 [Aureococcus anophagefferens]